MSTGAYTADGCSVEVYRLLPPAGEPEVVHDAIPAGASILELGCGAGRVTHPLLALGHDVVAVDDSPEMLALVRGAETVRARIGELRLGRVFDAVLLGSHLVNTPDEAERNALLAAARRHLVPGGRLLVEWHPPSWFEQAADSQGGQLGEVSVELAEVVRDGDLLSAVARYSARGHSWHQPFTVRRLGVDALENALNSADLTFDGWLTGDRRWFAATSRSGG
ncbi:class I SAM-dependent methyltransferase [Amycolatopsis sp. NPDC059027]|uniref:class I SAM-dependent methyltransferase n=1 Tax=Amycolatopsis sp. NPDC059027 TaxID=3346709 RepID=UPI0036702F46